MLRAGDPIQNCLLLVRGHLVLLQTDLARLYQVTPGQLLAQTQHFPGEFCFPLEPAEIAELADDPRKEGRPLHVFSEHGALVLAYLLNTPESIAMGIQVARAFTRFRQKTMHPHALAFAG